MFIQDTTKKRKKRVLHFVRQIYFLLFVSLFSPSYRLENDLISIDPYC
jgi:hypothetical protein